MFLRFLDAPANRLAAAQSGRGSFVTDRPVAVLMVFIAAVVFGFFSFQRLPVALMPELNYPTLTVRMEYPGAAPEEVENEISRPVEEALGVINGLSRISSVSRAGISDVVLEFLWGTDMAEASQNTLEKLDLVFLPNEAERPLLLHFDPALDPVMELSLSGSGQRYQGESGLRRLRRIADIQLKRELEPIPGVAAVRVRGGLEEEIHVRVDEQALRRAGISVQTVIDRLRQENINVAGGTVNEGDTEYMVRTLNEFANLSQIAETIVKRTAHGDVKVKDVAKVERSHKEREIVTRTNGQESVQIDIYKEAEANMVTVAKSVIGRVGQMNPSQAGGSWGSRWRGNQRNREEKLAARLYREEGAELKVVADRSVFIQSSINEVRNAAVIGGGLAVAVLFLFLKSPLATVIAGLSIPMSLLMTFAPLNIFGVTLNIMSLGGLALGIGMLVDSSIVVLESIFRCWSEGDNRREAAIRGVREVRGAVIASTLTSIAVFLPMVFVEGIAGQAFSDLGTAVVISLLASLAVAIFFIPMLASRQRPEFQTETTAGFRWNRWASWQHFQSNLALWRRDRRKYGIPYLWLRLLFAVVLETCGKVFMSVFWLFLAFFAKALLPAFKRALRWLFAFPAAWTEGFLVWIHRVYPLALGWSLRHPATMLFLTLVCVAATMLVGRTLGSELLPEVHQGEFTVEVNLPVGTPLEETRRIMGQVEEKILAEREDIQSLLTTYGYDATNIKRSDEGEHSARFKILAQSKNGALASGRSIAAVEEKILERIRAYLIDQPDITERVVRPVLFSFHKPIVVEIQGDDLPTLRQLAQEAEALLQNHRELADVETTLRQGAPEIQIVYDRQSLSRYGLNLGQVAEQVKTLVKGFESTRYNLKDRRIPIIVRLEEADRRFMRQIENLAVAQRAAEGSPNAAVAPRIPLNAVASLRIGEGPSEIRRVDGKRVALIQANLGQASLGEAVDKIEETLSNEIRWPAETSFAFSGQNKEWERSRASLYLALALSIFLVYVIMASQFESLAQPLIIMGTVPLAFFGSVIGLKLLGIHLSVVVFLGWILLIGIVVNNAIVLVDYANILRRRGLALKEAVITAGKVRLRPILMTTATTIFGLFPMALGLGDGAEIRTPMAVAVIFGLASSTVLTLLVIPTMYLWTDRLQSALFKQPSNEKVETSAIL